MDELNERQRTALELAQGQGEVGVADLREEHPHWSRWTYYRDLRGLCAAGLLERRGRRRWARYRPGDELTQGRGVIE